MKGSDMISTFKAQFRQGLLAPIASIALLAGSAIEVQAMSKAPPPPPGPTPAQAAAAQKSVHELAQGCYVIQSPANGKYMNHFHQGGLVYDGLSYQFKASSAAGAARFYLKPTSYFHYMLTDQDGRYLASHLPNEISAASFTMRYNALTWKLPSQPFLQYRQPLRF